MHGQNHIKNEHCIDIALFSCYVTRNSSVLICYKQMNTVFTPVTLTWQFTWISGRRLFHWKLYIFKGHVLCRVYCICTLACWRKVGEVCICCSCRIRICSELINTKMRFTSRLSFVSFFTKCNRNPVMSFGSACGRTQATLPICVYLSRVMQRTGVGFAH